MADQMRKSATPTTAAGVIASLPLGRAAACGNSNCSCIVTCDSDSFTGEAGGPLARPRVPWIPRVSELEGRKVQNHRTCPSVSLRGGLATACLEIEI